MASSDIPQPVASPHSPPSHWHRSGLDSFLSKLPGTVVQVYALNRLGWVLLQPAEETRFRLVLLGFVVVVVPTLASSAFDIARQFLSNKRSSPP